MADEIARFDPNYTRSLQAVSSVDEETSINLWADPSNNNALYTDATVSSSALPAGASTSAKQLADGHNVTVDNAAGAAAVNIQDGGNVITVDATNLDIRDLTSASDSVEVKQTAHDDLNVNANLQVGDADVGTANPVPNEEVVATGINGGNVEVGVTEVAMTFTGTTKSLMVQSKVDNTGSIWVGLTGVTNVGANALTQLSPGQSVSMDLNDAAAAIYAISDVAAQTVYKAALT